MTYEPCKDPACPACRLRALLQEFVDSGARSGDIMELCLLTVDSMFDDIHIDEVTGQETVH